jgi:DNA-binding protein H-NS
MSKEVAKLIEKMSFDELINVRTQVDSLLRGKQSEKRKLLLDEFRAKARESGLSLDEVVTASRGRGPAKKDSVLGRPKKQYKAKYQNPANPNETWTGLGKHPRWLREKLEAGEKLEKFKLPV